MDNIELGRRYDGIIERCVAIFEAKTKDYGPTWLFFRDESFVDQLWIKARRIRTLEENGDDSLVGEGRADEYLGIVNYGPSSSRRPARSSPIPKRTISCISLT